MILWPRCLIVFTLFLPNLKGGADRTALTLRRNVATERRAREIVAEGVDLDSGGIFLSRNNSVVETNLGSDVKMNCRVTRTADYGTISWFKNDSGLLRLLTVGDDTYIDDPRISIIRPLLSMNWSLQMVGVRASDGGSYVCQSTTYPPSSIYTSLVVYEAYAEISGGREKVFKVGTSMQLKCTIRDITKAPSYIFWYQNSRMINYDNKDGVQVGVSQLHSRTLVSLLTVDKVRAHHAGNYSCSPSLVRPDTVLVRVESMGEDEPEPVLNSGQTSYGSTHLAPFSTTLAFFLLLKILYIHFEMMTW